MTLFTRLKIILLQYFQFSVSTKISCIQMDPKFKVLLMTSFWVGRKALDLPGAIYVIWCSLLYA